MIDPVRGTLQQTATRSRPRATTLTVAVAALFLASCGTVPVAKVDSHLRTKPETVQGSRAEAPPAPVRQVPLPPAPQPSAEEKRYSVTVIDVPAREILLAMARDTGTNIDIHPGIQGTITLNAVNQTIKQILTRMSRQIDMRWEVEGPNIAVLPDSPYLRLYRVDYVNMNRDTVGTFGVQTQVIGTPGGTTGGGATPSGTNTSSVKIENSAKNRFWENLEKNIKDLLRETDKQLPKGSTETTTRQKELLQAATTQTRAGARTAASGSTAAAVSPGETRGEATTEVSESTLTFREAASVIVNAETGTISVRATSRQHEKIAQFIEQVSGSAKRQVLIEATIVEVELNDAYQSGVDWSALGLEGLGYSFRQVLTRSNDTPTGTNLDSRFFSVAYSNPNAAAGGNISSTIKLLSSFGNTKVLSSPRTTTLNNQTAVMKVVENTVYFTIKAEVTPGGTTTAGVVAYTSTPNVVPEGIVMSITPQIGENDIVTLNIRPSITKILRTVQDPNPSLVVADGPNRTRTIPSPFPIIQTREFETVLRVGSGQTTVLGGLMQDSFRTARDGLPVLSRIPILGDAVSYRNDRGTKSELVVFIRPVVLKDASVQTDLEEYRRFLPDGRFFKEADPIIPIPNPVIPDPVTPRQ
ncbi:MAG: type II and III secretion system protein [Burkholderiales bacterium]